MSLNKSWSYALASLIPLFVSMVLGYLFKPGAWYRCLNKSCMSPPGWVFAVVWTILYVFLGVAMIAACYSHPGSTWILPVSNIVLSLLFAPIMFGLHSVLGGAVITTACLLLGIGLLIQYSIVNYSALAIGLTVPYVLWLLLASYLAWYILMKNDCKKLAQCKKLACKP